MILPLSQLYAHDAHDEWDLDARIDAFTDRFGHAPNEASTFSQWAEVTPETKNLIWALRCVHGGARIAVEVAWRAAMRAMARVERPDPRSVAALALVRRWLDGEDVSADELRASASAAASAANAATGAASDDANAANAALGAANAASNAASNDADASVERAAYAAAATATAAATAAERDAYAANAYAYADAAYNEAYAAERAIQRTDILAITSAP